jgi:hypothetical protein
MFFWIIYFSKNCENFAESGPSHRSPACLASWPRTRCRTSHPPWKPTWKRGPRNQSPVLKKYSDQGCQIFLLHTIYQIAITYSKWPYKFVPNCHNRYQIAKNMPTLSVLRLPKMAFWYENIPSGKPWHCPHLCERTLRTKRKNFQQLNNSN